MKKDLGVQQAVFPMPVLMIATYGEDGKVDVMNAAWGNICDPDKIALFLDADHKTVKNMNATKAFTVSLASQKTMKQADFFGIASGNDMADKFERSGFTARKSDKVNAPIIEEFPVVMECELLEEVNTANLHCYVGKIVNVAADEEYLDVNGKLDVGKCGIIAFDNFKNGYYAVEQKVGEAWSEGAGLM